jgi:hypothetical protein
VSWRATGCPFGQRKSPDDAGPFSPEGTLLQTGRSHSSFFALLLEVDVVFQRDDVSDASESNG